MPKPFRPATLAAILLLAMATAGCAGEPPARREPVSAALLGGLMSGAMADCGNRGFATHVERARCEAVEARGSVVGLDMAYAFGDLVALMSEWRMRLARERDAGTLDAAGERARQKEFDAAFQREMQTRQRLHNNGARAIEFNFCEIEGNGLRCTTQTPKAQLERQFDEWAEECDRQDELGYFGNMEELSRCVYQNGMVRIDDEGNFPHMDLTRLYSGYFIEISRRFDEGEIGVAEFKRFIKAMIEQYRAEIDKRDRERAAGNIDWRRRSCHIANDRLICAN